MKRILYIDDIKAVGICLIVLSHISGAMGLGTNAVWKWSAPFMVGLFFASSGYLAAARADSGDGPARPSFVGFAAKKGRSLLLPYLIFSATALGIKLAVAHSLGSPLSDQYQPALREFVTFLGTGALWFLPAMFLAELIFFGVTKLPLWGRMLVLLLSAAAAHTALPLITAVHGCGLYNPRNWSFDYLYVLFRGLTAVGLMLLGYDVIPRIESRLGLNQSPARGHRSAVITAAVCALTTLVLPRFFFPDYRTLNFDGHAVFLYLDTLAATLLLILLFRQAEARRPLSLLPGIGRSSLIIMCTHNEWYLVHILQGGIAALLGVCPTIGPRYYLECGAILILILMMEHGLCDLIRFVRRK